MKWCTRLRHITFSTHCFLTGFSVFLESACLKVWARASLFTGRPAGPEHIIFLLQRSAQALQAVHSFLFTQNWPFFIHRALLRGDSWMSVRLRTFWTRAKEKTLVSRNWTVLSVQSSPTSSLVYRAGRGTNESSQDLKLGDNTFIMGEQQEFDLRVNSAFSYFSLDNSAKSKRGIFYKVETFRPDNSGTTTKTQLWKNTRSLTFSIKNKTFFLKEHLLF